MATVWRIPHKPEANTSVSIRTELVQFRRADAEVPS